MKILAIDTSSIYASCALLAEGDIRSEAAVNNGLVHSRSLMPMIERCLQNADTDIGQIDVFACVAGPGSFTGIRIGVCAVKGLAQALKKPCAAVNTLDCLRQNFPFASTVCPIMDARRGQVYNALFLATGEGLERLTPDRAISLAELGAELKNHNFPKIVVGDGAALCYNGLREQIPDLALAPEHLRWQSAWGVARAARELAARGELVKGGRLVPVYHRLSQAERERLAREHNETNGRGIQDV